MNESPRITYLLGAGASWFACPVLNEQGEKMVELATRHFEDSNVDFLEKPSDLDEKGEIVSS